MKEFHVTIMSIDPDDHSEDPHQKYGFTIQAKDEKEAQEKGVKQFKQQYGNLPIYWVKVF
jgi:hypothetical protein